MLFKCALLSSNLYIYNTVYSLLVKPPQHPGHKLEGSGRDTCLSCLKRITSLIHRMGLFCYACFVIFGLIISDGLILLIYSHRSWPALKGEQYIHDLLGFVVFFRSLTTDFQDGVWVESSWGIPGRVSLASFHSRTVTKNPWSSFIGVVSCNVLLLWNLRDPLKSPLTTLSGGGG